MIYNNAGLSLKKNMAKILKIFKKMLDFGKKPRYNIVNIKSKR